MRARPCFAAASAALPRHSARTLRVRARSRAAARRPRPAMLADAAPASPAPAPSGSEGLRVAMRTGGAALARLDPARVGVWAGVAAAVAALRGFFPVIFGTFIVGYVANSVVRWGVRVSRGRVPRRGIVALFYVGVVTAIAGFSVVTVPTVVREGQYFVRTLQSENPYVITANVMRRTFGEELVVKLETFVVYATDGARFDGEGKAGAGAVAGARAARAGGEAERDAGGEWSPERSRRLGMLLQKSIKGYVAGTAALLTKLLGASTKVVFKALVSLVFSFMILWDLPVIMAGVRRLGAAGSRVRFAYDELAPVFAEFGSVLGKSFEAQGAIAVINTTLTTAGLSFLNIPGIGFLSVVTLVCSFIPVAGVFISTLPMVILALAEYGAAKAACVVAMVVLVHLVEAYVLNPQIYSAHLHLHPFMVLVVLYIAEHLYGVAGLLMAVPVAVFLLRTLVLGEDERPGGAKDAPKLAPVKDGAAEG